MNKWLQEHLVCPVDNNKVKLKDSTLICPKGHTYPIIDGIPIMLLEGAKPTLSSVFKGTLRRVKEGDESDHPDGEQIGDRVDPFVQKAIIGTCGNLYRPLINKLNRYPIPELRLPNGSGEVFLEIGCNWGRWCISAAKKNYFSVGVDPSFDAIKAAQRVAKQLDLPVIYLVADARYLPFESNTFDVVFSYSVLQHFSKEEVRQSLTEIRKVLRPSGVSLIQMPNIAGIHNFYIQLKRGFKVPKGFDVRYWSPIELKEIFSRFIGPTSLVVDGFFSLNVQKSDADFLPLKYRLVVYSSGFLRTVSSGLPIIKYLADSLYVKSINKK